MERTLINGRWELWLPEHRAARPEWPYWEAIRLGHMHDRMTSHAVAGDLNPVIVDVGAEEGDFPALWSTWGWDVVLVEPNERVWPNIKAIFQANDLRDPIMSIVGFCGTNQHGTPLATVWPDCADGPIIGDHGFCNLSERPDIPATTIDMISAFVKIDAITMDVEGAELEVLLGAEMTLAVMRPLVWVSIHPDFAKDMYGRDHITEDVISLMDRHGYFARFLAFDHEWHWFFEPAR